MWYDFIAYLEGNNPVEAIMINSTVSNQLFDKVKGLCDQQAKHMISHKLFHSLLVDTALAAGIFLWLINPTATMPGHQAGTVLQFGFSSTKSQWNFSLFGCKLC